MKKSLAREESISGVKVVRVPYLFKFHKGFLMPGFVVSTFKAVKASDLVIINLPEAEGFIVALWAKILKKRVFPSMHARWSLLPVGQQNDREDPSPCQQVFLLFSDNIVTLTADFAKTLCFLKNYSKKVQSIYPIVILRLSIKKPSSIFGKLSQKKEYLIGFIGRIAPEKGIEYLFAAIPLLQKQLGDNFKIVIAGPSQLVGEKEYQKR